MKVKDLIEVLETFPSDFDICIGDVADSDDAYDIKAVFDCSESFEGWGGYAFVQIQPMPRHVDLDYFLDSEYNTLKENGDRVWYNTNTVFENLFNCLSTIKYKLSDEGLIHILSIKDKHNNDILIEDITDEEYWEDLF